MNWRLSRIGLTSRVIDVRTGQIVWVGQGAKRHLQLQEGMQILINKLVETMLLQPALPPRGDDATGAIASPFRP